MSTQSLRHPGQQDKPYDPNKPKQPQDDPSKDPSKSEPGKKKEDDPNQEQHEKPHRY